jgi:hypothetical protein
MKPRAPNSLAPLATLAAPSVETEIRSIGFHPVIHGWSKRGENQIETAIPAKIAKVAKVQPAVSGPHPYRLIFDALERRCPDFVPNDRWKRAIEDAQSFLAIWGTQADALGWTASELRCRIETAAEMTGAAWSERDEAQNAKHHGGAGPLSPHRTSPQ